LGTPAGASAQHGDNGDNGYGSTPGSLSPALEARELRVVLVEALGVADDRIGKDPEIVQKALGNDVEMTAGLFELPPVPIVRSGDGGPQSVDLRLQRPDTAIHRSEAAIH
jgi:hypothetical protein